jgi:hypothetical protein
MHCYSEVNGLAEGLAQHHQHLVQRLVADKEAEIQALVGKCRHLEEHLQQAELQQQELHELRCQHELLVKKEADWQALHDALGQKHEAQIQEVRVAHSHCQNENR